ncbi:MAG: four helix bundle protein [Candidatus Methylacidiphilales bacterium]|nr:four helix bundle protein [Candidatus Methylacidiphilales bacterium]
MKKPIQSFRDLEVYKQAFAFQQDVFRISNKWPKEETYSLTGQIRRSSRAIGANIAEAWAKRRYEAHFISKLTDADGELQESLHWLLSAEACEYVPTLECRKLVIVLEGIGRQLGAMMAQSALFCHTIKA